MEILKNVRESIENLRQERFEPEPTGGETFVPTPLLRFIFE